MSTTPLAIQRQLTGLDSGFGMMLHPVTERAMTACRRPLLTCGSIPAAVAEGSLA